MKRRLAIAAILGAGVAIGSLFARRRQTTGAAIPHTTASARNVELARLGSRVGATVASHRARRVFASAARREALDRELELKTGEQVLDALGSMKGALMKIGQMASFLDNGLPEPIRDSLAQLQQNAPPMSPALAAQVVEEELGGEPDKVFAQLDPQPIAAASIGQVHRAITRDGLAVAVKVQYPGVDDAIRADLDNSQVLIGLIGMMFPALEPGPVIEEIRTRLTEELDYRVEAKNQQEFADYYRGHPFIHVPDAVADLSAGRVITTELAEGARFSELDNWSQDERNLAGEAIDRFVFRSLYRMHAFNADPHPGNYLFRPGGRVTFLDFGLVRHFTADEVGLFGRMVQAIVIDRDASAFRRLIEAGGLLAPNAPVTDEQVEDYFAYFYRPLLWSGPTMVTHEYAGEAVRRLFDPRSMISEVPKYANVPPAFVLIQRINLGLFSVLAHLGATADWLAVARELWPFTNDPPSTPLGEEEAAWLATR